MFWVVGGGLVLTFVATTVRDIKNRPPHVSALDAFKLPSASRGVVIALMIAFSLFHDDLP